MGLEIRPYCQCAVVGYVKNTQSTSEKIECLVLVDNLTEYLEVDVISELINLKYFYMTKKQIAGCPSRRVLRITQIRTISVDLIILDPCIVV